MKFDVIVLAGGLGTRLRSVVSEVPKPMAPVSNQPFLDYILEKLPLQHIEKLVMAVGYKHQVIERYYGDSYQSIPIEYAIEEEPLGTGGGIKQALSLCTSNHVIILNGDTFCDVNYEVLWQTHHQQGFELTMALKQMDNPDRYGTVALEKNTVVAFNEKQVGLKTGLINAGVYMAQRTIANKLPNKDTFSFEAAYLEPAVGGNTIGGVIVDGLFIDIGIPEDYERAQSLFS
jgi:D-glycero-alpha-D-manno-heptose 1-phosphate guanylyltransferase